MPTVFSQDGKTAETIINRFDGGIVNDPRDPRDNVARMITNFDVLTDPKRMIPYRSSESGDSASATSRKRNFALAIRSGATYALFGLGVVSGAARAEVLFKALSTGAATDLDDNGWDTPTNNSSSAGTTDFNFFTYYQRTGYIYGARAGTNIWRFDPDSGDTWADSNQALTYTWIGQGLVHSKDDILYVPYYQAGGFIARNNNGTWNTTALTLPIHYIPSSICEFGHYLAIACVPTSGVGNSKVYLWDRDSSLTTVSESIDWGEGTLTILEEVDGELIGISQKGGAATTLSAVGSGTAFNGLPIGTIHHRDRVIFRKLVGKTSVKIFELAANHASSANTTQLPLYKQKVNNRLYFQMMIEFNGAVRDGVWSIGRAMPDSPFSLIHERTSNNNTALDTGDTMRGFIMVGDYLFQAYIDTDYAVTKTDDSTTAFSHNSVYESKRFGNWGIDQRKDLIGISITYEPMPAAGDVTVQYRVDGNNPYETTSWTTISNDTTDNSINDTAINIESSGAALPKFYREIEFRILSTGGAIITGFSFKEQLVGRTNYE